jgi:hypothetical protein
MNSHQAMERLAQASRTIVTLRRETPAIRAGAPPYSRTWARRIASMPEIRSSIVRPSR